jgi:hypothetical protein
MSATTRAGLLALIEYLNELTGSPSAAYRRESTLGVVRQVAQVGHYHLGGTACGYSLYRMSTPGGGVDEVLYGQTKTELAGKIRAFVKGYELAAQRAREATAA